MENKENLPFEGTAMDPNVTKDKTVTGRIPNVDFGPIEDRILQQANSADPEAAAEAKERAEREYEAEQERIRHELSYEIEIVLTNRHKRTQQSAVITYEMGSPVNIEFWRANVDPTFAARVLKIAIENSTSAPFPYSGLGQQLRNIGPLAAPEFTRRNI